MSLGSRVEEPARHTPVVWKGDICVIGGSCTGVFAALAAARRGARVALVEKAGCFGGVATLSLVNVWHTSLDERFEKEIFRGLSLEVIDRLRRRDAVFDRARSPHWAWAFNTQELQIELDEMIRESPNITPMLHTLLTGGLAEEGKVTAALVENKSGRGAIQADVFIDASGDADLCERLGVPTYRSPSPQPSTTCAAISGWKDLEGIDWQKLLRVHGPEFDLPLGFAWGAKVPGSDIFMMAATRVQDADCADSTALTRAEMEGRRQVRAILDILRREVPSARLALQALPARIGIRETRHVKCGYQLAGDDILQGRTFADAIANGSYRVDIHHHDQPGITLRYLDGREHYCRPGHPNVESRWRPETPDSPTYYQIPYRSLVPGTHENLLVAGRMLDADPVAHAAVRVMVNMNQTGEAVGTAAALSLQSGQSVTTLDPAALRAELARGGAIVL